MFLGRTNELNLLKNLRAKRTASLVIIKGRRRIGKTRLAEEFAKIWSRVLLFSALPPEPHTQAETERTEFAAQLARIAGISGLQSHDWGDLFWHLAQHTQTGHVLIVLDEINWMGSKDPTFLGKLKIAWDLYFSKAPNLMLILSGSMSA